MLSDRQQLESIMAELRIDQRAARKGSAWLGEKLTRLKLLVDDVGAGESRLMETTELISLGIEGKCALWLVLAAIAPDIAELSQFDFQRLIRRAQSRRARLELRRLEVAREAFLCADKKTPSR